MYRGQMVLRMGNLELASFCIEHASELGSGLGQSPTQQAIVLSFLKNYDKVRFNQKLFLVFEFLIR